MTRDFPYYNGVPAGLGPGRWACVLLSVLAAYLALLWLLAQPGMGMQWLGRVIFAAFPLLVLGWATGGRQAALFGPLNARGLCVALAAAVVAMVASAVMAIAVQRIAPVAPNPFVTALGDMPWPQLLLQLLSTVPQLLGEELLTILPLLAILQLCTRWGMARGPALLCAVIASTLVFAAAHLPTYDWNWLQCLGVIGTARVVLTLAYVLTRNLWVSTGAHVLNDWTEFLAMAWLVSRP